MVMAALLAGLAGGVPILPVALLAGAWWAPGPTAMLVVLGIAARRVGLARRIHRPAELQLLDVAADLRSGLTLRAALAVDGRMPEAVVRMAAAGSPPADLACQMVKSDVPGARLLAPSLALVGETGGSAAGVFESVAGMLIDDDLVRREIRAAATGPLAQALVVGGVPVVALAWSVLSGSFGAALARGGLEGLLAAVGAIQVVAGGLLVWLLTRRMGRWR
jgi:Flp pilus assembly protein TadB